MADAPVVVLRLRDGRTSTIPVEMLAVDRETFVRELARTGIAVRTGRFRETMIVALENDGPVTFTWP